MSTYSSSSSDSLASNLFGPRISVAKDFLKTHFDHPETEVNIRILATLVPDEIIYLNKLSDFKQKCHTGVLFFADVSGFTDLCERFNKQGKIGASRITKVLNEYMGIMVQEVIAHNGDILNFSGDAFLALWKTKDYAASMTDVVHAAIDCALGIQKSHGQYQTDVGIVLRVKIALAAGQIILLVIGDSNFMVLGNAMFDVKDVGNICNPGEIIISPTVKVFIEPDQYIMEPVSGIPFIKILGIDSEWSPSKLALTFDLFDDFKDQNKNETFESDMSLADNPSPEILDAGDYVLRPSINYAVSQDMEMFLRKFVIHPIIRAIDMGEPLENLTEMRQVVIVFVNIVIQVYSIKELEALLEKTYANICELVNETGGCMNKVSMFDKDLMFLLIFGLRGFKHKLQAQQALYCSRKIRDSLKLNKKIISASVGVTMGATYCGVVGHPMRKEYTVIGSTVNKAARLMIAYPDMVTCDRQTFLESQLQSRYFTLQPKRYLKGFTNVGPVYKYDDDCSEEYIIEREWLQTNTYPILDRPRELELFFGLLNMKMPYHSTISLLRRHLSFHEHDNLSTVYSLRDFANHNMMIIEGAARRGKTRILNEIRYYVKSEVPHYKCTLDKNSRKYKIFRCILCEGCKISNIKDLNTRTKYVWRILIPFRVPQFLCALNDMLLVNFQHTLEYSRLSNDEKFFVKRKMVKYLSHKIFKTVSLITIDNMENMEDESWIMYKEIIDCENTFTCATISTNAYLPEESKYLTEAPDTVTIRLLPIHELYHSALICQFLNVRGISVELEKYVQAHSYGNPGWIESFLTTLRHSSILKKLDMEKKHAFQQGFVLPNINLLKRLDRKKLSGARLIQLTSVASSCQNSFEKDDLLEGWEIYEQTLPVMSEEYDSSELITVCTLTKEVGLEEIDTEEFVDMHMLHTYDSLNVHEQHVLKCSAILGEQFTRYKLEYVIESNYDINTAMAIQRLFEINVFRCVRASYNNGDITVRHDLTDPRLEQEAKCECEGFPEELNFPNLPKYASCSYICFREPAFRQMCLNLLTETQANLFHIRAIWYLENQTRRCYSCGRGYFERIFGQSNDDGMRKYSIEVLSTIKNRTRSFKLSETYQHSDKDIREKIAQLKNYRQAIKARPFDETNLFNCRCVDILMNMYSEIIEHNQEIGRNEALLQAMLEYAELCVRYDNDSVAFTLIAKATNLLNEKLKYEFAYPSWQVPIAEGRISTLLGRLFVNRRDFVQAEACLKSSLKSYNLSFPSSKLAVKAAIKYQKYRQKLSFMYYPDKYVGCDNNDIRILAEQTANTLRTLHTLYLFSQQYDKAYLASIWGLTEARRSNANFYINCIAFRNMIRMELLYPNPHIIRIENMALQMCYRKYSRLEPHEFEAVIKMYSAIFLRIGIMENILTALRLGGTIMTINSPKYGGYYSWRANPFYIRFMIFTYNIKQLVNVMQELLAYKTLPSFKGLIPSPMKTYVMAMQFMLKTTYSIIPFSVCKSCFPIKIEPSPPKIIESQIEMSYYIVIWLWHIRKMDWQASKKIYHEIADTKYWPPMKDPAMSYFVAQLVEGLLLLYVEKINQCDMARLPELHDFIKYAMAFLKKYIKLVLVIRSRYYFLKAYYNRIYKHIKKSEKYLEIAEQYALNFCNFFESDWIKHNRKAWNNWPGSSVNDRWMKSAKTEKVIKTWDDFDKKKLPMFTLRLPTLQPMPSV